MSAIRRRALTVLLALGLALGSAGAPRDARGQQADADEALPLDPVQRLAAIEARVAAALADVERATAEKARVEAELAGLAEGRAAANRRVRERTRSLYRISRAGALPLAGGIDSMISHAARVERLERMVRHDVRALGDLRSRAAALRGEAGRLASEIESARARVAQLEAQRGALEEDARRAALYAAAFQSVTPLGAYAEAGGGYGIRVVDPPPVQGFEAERGQLALPIAAPRALREASREDGGGLELDGARGATVQAASSGRVAFSDRHPTYGRMVILDHGGGFFTIYGGVARVDVHVGDRVSRGAALGAVDGEPLFFQVRRGTRALDARAWLGI